MRPLTSRLFSANWILNDQVLKDYATNSCANCFFVNSYELGAGLVDWSASIATNAGPCATAATSCGSLLVIHEVIVAGLQATS